MVMNGESGIDSNFFVQTHLRNSILIHSRTKNNNTDLFVFLYIGNVFFFSRFGKKADFLSQDLSAACGSVWLGSEMTPILRIMLP
jgi:hypothetical protein